MAQRIGGWNVIGTSSVAGGVTTADKPGQANKQHVIFALDIDFSSNPGASVKWEILAGDTSPATVLASGYAAATGRAIYFQEGLCVPIASGVSAFIQGAGGSVTTIANLHGITR